MRDHSAAMGQKQAWDVTVPDTYAKSHVISTAVTPGAAAHKAAQSKTDKYTKLASTHIFCPDKLVQEVVKTLQKNKFEVMVQPRIPTEAGIRKPDIVAWQPSGPALVTDGTVVADHSNLGTVHVVNIKYYDTPEIRRRVSELGQCADGEIEFLAVACNWRGAICKQSAKDLKSYGFTQSDLRWLSVTVICESFGISVKLKIKSHIQ